VDHPCAITRLDNVAVLGYRGWGIRQRGGSLLAQSTIVANTQAHPESLSQGTGMLLTCGVIAELSDVLLDSNESAGLLMAGPGTQVEAFDLSVEGTRVHPSVADPALGDPWGAVHVRDQANLEATSCYIAHNWFTGVFVDTGAEAVLDHGTIVDTIDIGRFFEARTITGGSGAAAFRGGHLQMLNFIVSRADVCGVQVAQAGEMDLTRGQVSHNAIGACVQVPGYDLARLTNDVQYVDNAVTSEAADFAVPEPLTPVGL
jgi:hypothetical protein